VIATALRRGTDQSWSLGSELSVSVGACPDLGEALGALLGRPAPKGTCASAEQVALELAPFEPAGWMLLVNGTPTLRIRSSDELAPAIEGLLVGWAVRTRGSCLALHGAGATISGRTVILVGTSGAGKSSTCLSLALRGARYLGDEVVFVRRDDLALEAFPKAITLKLGSFHLAPKTETHADPARGPIRYFLPEISARMGDTGAPATRIVFPRFDRNCAQTRATWMSPEETAFRLVEQTFGGTARMPGTFTTLARLAAEGAYAVEFSDAAEVCERIEQLVETA